MKKFNFSKYNPEEKYFKDAILLNFHLTQEEFNIITNINELDLKTNSKKVFNIRIK